MNLRVHGEKDIPTHLSNNNFSEINVLGQAFLMSEELAVNIHGKAKKAHLVRDDSTLGDDEL